MYIKLNNNFLMNKNLTYDLLSRYSKNDSNLLSRYKKGEVFTPVEIIDSLLDNLDKYYSKTNNSSIFANKNIKWLDSSAGIGNFFIPLFYRLYNNIPIVNEHHRIRHIINNMLYFAEIDKSNAALLKELFSVNGLKPNLFIGNSLKKNLNLHFKVNGFDVIIGNPPYNQNGITSIVQGKNTQSNTIWPLFIHDSFQALNQNGYLVYITPLSWLKNSHPIYNEILIRELHYLMLLNHYQSFKQFNVKIPISLFICQNKIQSNPTICKYLCPLNTWKTEKISLLPNYSLPIGYFSIFKKLISFIENNNLHLDILFKTVNSTGSKSKLPSTYSLSDNLAVDSYTHRDGIIVKKTNSIHPHAHIKKLILANKSSLQGAFIDNGHLSLTGNHKAYIIGSNLELMKSLFNYKLIRLLENYMKFYQDLVNRDVYNYIPDIRLLKTPINESNLYKKIGFTESELKEINKF